LERTTAQHFVGCSSAATTNRPRSTYKARSEIAVIVYSYKDFA